MIILNKPYVSDFLIDTIKKNNYLVLDNEVSREYFDSSELVSTQDAIKLYKEKNEPIYSNSENSIEWVCKNLSNTHLSDMIETSKNKVKFRKAVKNIFEDYYFAEVAFENLKNFNVKKVPFPVVLKPSVGFLSFGVYPINNEKEWIDVLSKISNDIENLKGIFPKDVVNMSDFIIEKMIDGDEYAIDGYFDNDSKAVILNIFQHPFFNDKDVSDRAYYTSKPIMQKYLTKFNELLNKIGEVANYSNFPFHLELRANNKEIIPIELNPMRMCGWCITDIAHFAWGINVYDYYQKQLKPDWDRILKDKDDSYYYFTIGDIPSVIDRNSIQKIDMDNYLSNITEVLDLRKIDYKMNPIFAIAFGKTKELSEIEHILELDMMQYIK